MQAAIAARVTTERRADERKEPHDAGEFRGGVGVHKQANRIVEVARVSFVHLLGEVCKQGQKKDGTTQPGNERRAQSRKHGWSSHVD